MKYWMLNAALSMAVMTGGTGVGFAQLDDAVDEEAAVEPVAADVVRSLGAHIGGLQHFRLEVVDTIDNLLENGQKVQHAHLRTALVSRPDRLVLESRGDIENRKLVKSADTVTLMDTDSRVYAQVPFTGTIDEMMDRLLLQKYGVTVPLADFLGGDPSAELLEGTYEEAYLGLHHAGSNLCHHVAFRQDDIDWQAWMDAGDTPLLRKLVITYKNEAGAPQYAVHLKSLQTLEAPPADEAYSPPIPDGFERIDILSIDGTKESAAVEPPPTGEGGAS